MSDEFTRTGPNVITRTNGFTVETRFAEVRYVDPVGSLKIYAEWGGNPTEAILDRRSLEALAATRANVVRSNVTRALAYLGHRVDWRSGF
jgi:hypothetical protein